MGKKKYEKPEIKKIKLTPEEMVLAGCKKASGGAFRVGRCRSVPKCTNKVRAS